MPHINQHMFVFSQNFTVNFVLHYVILLKSDYMRGMETLQNTHAQ